MDEWQTYDVYCLADRRFYDTPERAGDGASRFDRADRPAPPGWRRREAGLWVMLEPRGQRLPEQGWKVHVTATLPTAARTIERTWDYCVEHGLAFKFLRSKLAALLANAKYADRGTSGKLMAIYPPDEAALDTVLTGLSEVLDGTPGPYILGDLRYGKGPLHVRYGGFRRASGPSDVDDEDEPVFTLRTPDGLREPDRRGSVFALPSWVTLPPILEPSFAARRGGAGRADEFPYVVERPLHFSNGGGVYLARARDGGERVVLREARPHAGLDRDGVDAVGRLERERRALERLADTGFVPRLLGHFVAWEHHFLAVEYIDAESLQDAALRRHPLVHPASTATDRAQYAAWVRDVLDRVDGALRAIHARGMYFGDLHPGNVLLTADGRVVLVDLELAGDLADAGSAALAAPGFAPSPGVVGAAADRHALRSLRLWLYLPIVELLEREPGKLASLERYAGGYFPSEPRVTELTAAERMFAAPGLDWPAVRDAMATAIHAAATPERSDRLFPGDPKQFRYGGHTFAYGAAGVLWAMHRAGVQVPAEYPAWLLGAVMRPGLPSGRGLYDGAYGVSAVLDALGWHEAAREILDLARAGAQPLSPGLFGGQAGVVLALLHFGHLDAAAELGDRLAARVGEPTRNTGLLRGMSGVALALMRLAGATGEARYLDAAGTALRHDLVRCVTLPDGTVHVLDGSRNVPYLDRGSAGIAVVGHELLHSPAGGGADAEAIAAVLDGVKLICRAPFVREPGLHHGRAGLIIALRAIGTDADRATLDAHVRRLGWHALAHEGGVAFPGARLRRLSMDLATGTAGVLLAVHAATEATGEPVLPLVAARPVAVL